MDINITIVLVIMTGLISYQAFNNHSMRQQLLFHPASIKEFGQYYRFVTSGFIHANWTHLIFNMIVLYQLGQFTEYLFLDIFGSVMGRIVYVLFYLSAIVVASIPSYFRHQDNHAYAALGASGATSAIIFSFILFRPWEWFVFPPLPGIVLGIGFLWYSSYMDKKGTDNIGHNAHLWGAIYGIVFTVVAVMAVKPELWDVIWYNLLQGPSMPNFN